MARSVALLPVRRLSVRSIGSALRTRRHPVPSRPPAGSQRYPSSDIHRGPMPNAHLTPRPVAALGLAVAASLGFTGLAQAAPGPPVDSQTRAPLASSPAPRIHLDPDLVALLAKQATRRR